jgi:hypothetical protein
MTTPRDPDARITAFFETPQPDLPERAFEAIRRDIHATRQTRGISDGLRFAFAFAAVLVVALVVVSLNLRGQQIGGPGRSPTPVPSASPSPSAASPGASAIPTPAVTGPVTFISPLYGYSIEVPAGWGATPAAVRWDGVTEPSLGPNVDLVSGPHLIALGFAGPFAGDLTAFSRDRIAATARDHADTCGTGPPEQTQSITIGGQPALLLSWNCGARIDLALTVRGGIGYAFTIRDAAFSAVLDPTDLATVRSMLDSLTFPPTPTPSP